MDSVAILSTLERLCKSSLPSEVVNYIREVSERFGQAKIVLKQGKYYIESRDPSILRELLTSPAITDARVPTVADEAGGVGDGFILVIAPVGAEEAEDLVSMLNCGRSIESISDEGERERGGRSVDLDEGVMAGPSARQTYAFEVNVEKFELVKRGAQDLNLPLFEVELCVHV